MATADESRQARELMEAARQSGTRITFNDAVKQGREKPEPNVKEMLEASIVALHAKLEKLEGELHKLRITGPGFSGQGLKIVYNAPQDEGGVQAAPVVEEELIYRVQINGIAVDTIAKARLAE